MASPLVTLVDFAHTALGETCPWPVYVDDEGTRAEDVVIIEKGVLRSFLHNRESASHFGVQPKGNARAYLFSDEPLIRMRNTGILSKLEDMIASVEDGYYLIKPSNGQADLTSEFMFGVTLGYEIKNGRVGREIPGEFWTGVWPPFSRPVPIRPSVISPGQRNTNSTLCGEKSVSSGRRSRPS